MYKYRFSIILMAIISCFAGLNVESIQHGELTVSFSPENLTEKSIKINDKDYVWFECEDGFWDGQEGDPAITYYLLRIGIPFGVTPEISNIQAEYIEKEGTIAPIHTLSDVEKTDNIIFSSKYNEKESFRKVFISDFEQVRSQYIARVYIPIINSSQKNRIEILSSISFNINYDVIKSNTSVNEEHFEKYLKNILVNYEYASEYRQSIQKPFKSTNDFGDSNIDWFSFNVNKLGVYKITYESLIDNDIIQSTLSTSDIRLFQSIPYDLPLTIYGDIPEPLELPLLFEDGGDGIFNSGDYFLFLAYPKSGSYRDSLGEFHGYLSLFDTLTTCWLGIGSDGTEPMRLVPERISSSLADSTTDAGWVFEHTERHMLSNEEKYWYWEATGDFTVYITDSRISEDVSPNCYLIFNPYSPDATIDGVPSTIVGNFYLPWIDANAHSGDISSFGANTFEVEYSEPNTHFRSYSKMYRIFLRAKNNMLRFTSLDTIYQTYELSGFSQEPYIFDITHLDVPRLIQSEQSSSNYRFTDTLINREYFVSEKSEINDITNGFSREDNFVLRGSSDGADFLIIKPEDFDISEYSEYRSSHSNLLVKTVNVEDIYREFGFGTRDFVSIRDFIRYTYENWSPVPSYVLLAGDGHYDYFNRNTSDIVRIPPASTASHYADGFFVELNSTIGIEMLIGRFPVKTQDELDIVTEKIISYESELNPGLWKMRVLSVADDEYNPDRTNNVEGFGHTTKQSDLMDSLYSSIYDSNPFYTIEFPLNTFRYKPEANEKLIQLMQDGNFFINYLGHGSQLRWMHEDVFNLERDVPQMTTGSMLPFISSFSCYVSKFFLTWTECIAEEMFRMSGGGAIGTLAATDGSYPYDNSRYNNKLFTNVFFDDWDRTIGDLCQASKTTPYPGHDSQYLLFGDPAMKLTRPAYRISIDNSDSLIGGEVYTVSGEIVSIDDEVVTDFNGIADILLRDSGYDKFFSSEAPEAGDVTYWVPGNILYNGETRVRNGQFELSFVLPIDISNGLIDAKLTAYAYGTNSGVAADAAGAEKHLMTFRPVEIDTSDREGPEIICWMNSRSWQTGEVVCENPILYAEINDPKGINITGSTGHKIALYLDGNTVDMIDLTPFFRYDEDSYTSGSIEYNLTNIGYGNHTATIIAWDNLSNSSVYDFDFEVGDCDDILFDILPYPSPFSDETDFTFGLTQEAEIEIIIYSLSGTKIRTLTGYAFSPFGKIHWDGRDENGTEIGAGTYIYYLKSDTGTRKSEFRGKISKIY